MKPDLSEARRLFIKRQWDTLRLAEHFGVTEAEVWTAISRQADEEHERFVQSQTLDLARSA